MSFFIKLFAINIKIIIIEKSKNIKVLSPDAYTVGENVNINLDNKPDMKISGTKNFKFPFSL